MPDLPFAELDAHNSAELFANAYRRFGAETTRHPAVEVSGRVKASPMGNGYTLQIEACTTQAPFDGHFFV